MNVLYPSLYSLHDLSPDIGDSPPPAPPSPAAAAAATASENEAAGGAGGSGGGRGVEGIWGRPRAGVDVPVALPPTSEKLSSSGVFLLDTGEELLLYVGRSVSGEVMSELFGVDAVPGEYGTVTAAEQVLFCDSDQACLWLVSCMLSFSRDTGYRWRWWRCFGRLA